LGADIADVLSVASDAWRDSTTFHVIVATIPAKKRSTHIVV
jgi:hypothetical protein